MIRSPHINGRAGSKVARSVMVIDDDDVCRSILCEMLTEEGYDCRESEDARDALRRLKAWPADLIIVDMLMPDFDGVETIMALRQGWPGTRIVALSGGSITMSPDYLLCLARNLGADATLTKPVHLEALAAVAERLLAKSTGAAETPRIQPCC